MRKLLRFFLYLLMPVSCIGQQIKNTDENLKVYHEIYSVLKNHYPLFQYRGYYNLDSAYEKYKPEVIKSTTRDQLGLYCCHMIQGLEDFHVRIYGESGKCYALSTPLHWHQLFYNDSLQRVFWNNSDNTLYQSNFAQLKSVLYDDKLPMIRYSKSNELGYLNITRLETKFDATLSSKDSKLLAKTMDSIVSQFKTIKVLLIDLRSCMGGWTEYGEIMASRLTKKRIQYATTVYFKTAKDSSSAIQHFINPEGPEQLEVPVIILTNKVVRSAAEDFILMLKQLPNVYIIGEPTWGAFSESRVHKLSNGWRLQYSNEKVYSPHGEIYEGRGIPVDLRIDNTWEDITNKSDKVLTEAIVKALGFNK